MSASNARHDGLEAVAGVMQALADNGRQLQLSLGQHRLLPFARDAAASGLGEAHAAVLSGPAGGRSQQQQQQRRRQGWGLPFGLVSAAAASPAPAAAAAAGEEAEVEELVCIEYTKGKRRVYRRRRATTSNKHSSGGSGAAAAPRKAGRAAAGTASQPSPLQAAAAAAGAVAEAGFSVRDDAVRHRQRLRDGLSDYLLPQGYPGSVAPQYRDYMNWRGVQYFFGGAMSVFTTRSLLSSLGVSNRHSGEAAAAINWVLKDGAGRMGRFLFARWGRQLDCELKQFRLGGDILMEAGAALELSTVLAPRWFLPLACTANLAKNLAAVAASSTRAPIYRTFALQNNLADVTAKGESVANLADVVGTAFGIALAKANLPVVPTFCALSLGYLMASRREVDSVVLPYLNRARLSYAARAFYSTGVVPGLTEANTREPLMPWSDPHSGRVVLGACVDDACGGPEQLRAALAAFKGRQYALTYRPDKRKCYILLRQEATPLAVLQAALDAHCLLWILDQQQQRRARVPAAAPAAGANGISRLVGRLHRAARLPAEAPGGATGTSASSGSASAVAAARDALQFVASNGPELFRQFERQAEAEGWRVAMTMLNPHETRLGLVA